MEGKKNLRRCAGWWRHLQGHLSHSGTRQCDRLSEIHLALAFNSLLNTSFIFIYVKRIFTTYPVLVSKGVERYN